MNPVADRQRLVPVALLDAADVAIGTRDVDVAWATVFLLGDEFREKGRLVLDGGYLPLVYNPELADHVRRGLGKLTARDPRLRLDGFEVSLDGPR